MHRAEGSARSTDSAFIFFSGRYGKYNACSGSRTRCYRDTQCGERTGNSRFGKFYQQMRRKGQRSGRKHGSHRGSGKTFSVRAQDNARPNSGSNLPLLLRRGGRRTDTYRCEQRRPETGNGSVGANGLQYLLLRQKAGGE